MSDYQEIDFVETNVETIETELLNMYEEIMNESVAPGSPVRLFIMWIAQVIVQQRVIINDSAKSNVPRYARGEYLDSLSELFWDEQRLKSDYARAMFRFYLSEAQQINIEIPAGTRITPDGDLMFATTETIMIKAGQTYGDVEAVCETAGEIGNDYKPGQINIIIDPYDYYDHAENTETTQGGAEDETDAAFYERRRNASKAYSTAGPEESYIYHAQTASSAVVDATATSTEAGVVDVRILLKSTTTAPDALIKDIHNKLSAKTVRPLTDKVIVSQPDTVDLDIDLSYWVIQPPQASSTKEIQDAVTAAVEKYKEWQTGKIGRDINPSKLQTLVMEAGAKRVVIRSPEFTVLTDTQAAKVKSSTVKYEGVENE